MDKGKKLTADIRDGKIKGAIFDLDGVLLDSMTIWTDLGERYLAMHRFSTKEARPTRVRIGLYRSMTTR